MFLNHVPFPWLCVFGSLGYQIERVLSHYDQAALDLVLCKHEVKWDTSGSPAQYVSQVYESNVSLTHELIDIEYLVLSFLIRQHESYELEAHFGSDIHILELKWKLEFPFFRKVMLFVTLLFEIYELKQDAMLERLLYWFWLGERGFLDDFLSFWDKLRENVSIVVIFLFLIGLHFRVLLFGLLMYFRRVLF